MSTAKKILFVEDDADFRESLIDAFKIKGFNAIGAGSVEEYEKKIHETEIDLAFVDLNLPDGSGFAVTRSLRQTSGAKIIILSARETVGDRVEGYTHGADIYMIKPTSIVELLAAGEALLRPRQATPANQNWQLNYDSHSLSGPDGSIMSLNKRQNEFLSCLMNKPGELIERNDLWKVISPNKQDKSGKALSMFVARLRKDIEKQTSHKIPIETISGRGFMFNQS
jgi:two-component system OmpR family response regulator